VSNFFKRLITGTVFVTVIVAGILWSQYSYFLVFLTAVLLGILEFSGILKSGRMNVDRTLALLTGLFWYACTFLILAGKINAVWLSLIIPMSLLVFVVELYRKSDTPLQNIAATLLVPLYIALPFSALHYLVFFTGEYVSSLLLGFFVLVWSNDTGAYLVGVTLGKHKLFPGISPKKSWEGFVGGVIFAQLAAYFISMTGAAPDLIHWMAIALIVSVVGTYGDLVESMIKRSFDLKDSGNILPGHGGILDRFDAVLFAAPMICVYLMLLL
jgi:phosphatidate cytidylyltransferase